MSLAKVYGSTVQGVEASLITIEVHIAQGTKFFMVGLPDSAVKESEQRVESALKYYGYRMPRQRVVVNLAPADIKKVGSAYDLPIAVGILTASHQLEVEHLPLEEHIIMGELALDGKLRPIKGALPIAVHARQQGFKSILLPKESAHEAAIVDGLRVIPLDTLKETIEHLENKSPKAPLPCRSQTYFTAHSKHHMLDFSEVQGQMHTKRALEIAAAGGHNVIMIGSPGSGKTMLAKRLPSILPPLSLQEALEASKIHSVVGLLSAKECLLTQRPFRAPHHTISDVALVGGGTQPQPGEISLAHNGILFLDELPEFKRSVLEVMRQPLEERRITISRAKTSVTFPANFMLIASMNPCPCGYYTHPTKVCSCSSSLVQRYISKISGPLLDRIDLHVEVPPVPFEEMSRKQRSEKSSSIRDRIISARDRQQQRLRTQRSLYHNAMISPELIHTYCKIDTVGQKLLQHAIDTLGLSGRAYDRILKVSRTIADLSDDENIRARHLAEAIQYRNLDRAQWTQAATF